MFARGWAYLRTAQFPVPKNLAAKPRVSITSKLIGIKGLQLHYFGHLRKTGGRGGGSYQFHSVVADLEIGHYNGKSAGPPAAARRGWLYNKWVSIRAKDTYV
jgi:hypothetical protein